MSACKSCGAAVVWVLTESRKRMPVDAEPTADGVVLWFGEYEGPFMLVSVGGRGDEGEPVKRYTSHFATCEFADKHRRRQ